MKAGKNTLYLQSKKILFFIVLLLISFLVYKRLLSAHVYIIYYSGLALSLIIFAALHKKNSLKIAQEKINSVTEIFKYIVLLLLFYFASCFIYRIFAIYQFGNSQFILKTILSGSFFDMSTLRLIGSYIVYGFLVQFILLLFLPPNIYQKEFLFFKYCFFTFTLLVISIQGYLWGWVRGLNRFVGLELPYILDIPFIKYDYYYSAITLLLLLCCVFIYFRIEKSKKKIQFLHPISVSLVLGFPLFFLSPILSIYSYTQWLPKIWIFDEKTMAYTPDSWALINDHYLAFNPIGFLVDNSLTELYRVQSFNINKKLSPFFQRPNLPESESNVNLVKNNLGPQEKYIDAKYPAYRMATKDQTKNLKPYNVVLIVLETYEPNESESFSHKTDKPLRYFEQLKKESLVLNQCFANAQTTYEGETALGQSMPVWGIINGKEDGMYLYSKKKNWLSIFKESGYFPYYSTSWDSRVHINIDGIQGKILKFLNVDNALKNIKIDPYSHPFILSGIENVSDLFDDDLKWSKLMVDSDIHADDQEGTQLKLGPRKHGEYYVHDEFSYEKLYNKITKLKEPFVIVNHTWSSHYDYPIPKGFKPKGKISRADRYYLSMKYSDQALEAFFNKIKKHPIYQNTIFVLIADHAANRKHVTLYDEYHIPALIHAPGLILPGEINDVTFQIDIGPTLIELLNLEGRYNTFGTPLLSKEVPQRGMILPDWDGYLIFVYDPYIARVDVNKVHEIYNFRENKYRNLMHAPNMQPTIDAIHHEFLKTYQLIADTAYGNRLIPSESSH